jgi:hypothetical protein
MEWSAAFSSGKLPKMRLFENVDVGKTLCHGRGLGANYSGCRSCNSREVVLPPLRSPSSIFGVPPASTSLAD